MATGLTDFLVRLGPTLGLGSTIILGVGALALALLRSPLARQRLGEMTIAATLIWIALACLPMRRFELSLATTEPSNVDSPDAKSAVQLAAEDDATDRQAPTVPELAMVVESGNTTLRGPRSDLTAGKEDATGSWSPSESNPVAGGWGQFRWPALGMAYLAGAVLCGAWLALGRALLTRVELAAVAAPPWLQETYQSLSGVRPARLLVSARTRRPFSYGILRPTIMLPAEIVLPDCARLLQHVLRHEQAHIQRRDAWGHALLNAAFPVLYVNPLYWWLRGRVQFARELIADDWAGGGGAKSSYAQDLLRLLKRRDVSLAGPIGALGVYLRNPLARRMKMLLQREDRLPVRLRWTAAAAITGGSLLVVAIMSCLLGSRIDTARGEETGPPSAAEESQTDTEPMAVVAEKQKDASQLPAVEQRGKGPPLVLRCVVSPIADVDVPARADGQVTAIEVKQGATVEAGQVLARIDDEIARLQLQASEYVAKAGQIQSSTDADVRLAQSGTALKIARATYGKQLAEATVAKAELRHHQVVAPFAGVVVQCYVAKGDWLHQGDRVCRIVRMDRVKVEAYVDSAAYNPGELVGRNVSVTVQRARNQRVHVAGKITYVSPEVQTGGEFQIVAELDNRKAKEGFWALRPGMTGKLTIGKVSLAVPDLSQAESRLPAAVEDHN